MDAITMLKDDHKKVKALFRAFDGLGERATARKREIVNELIKELSVHAVVEEQLFYPAARTAEPDALDLVLESLEEHHVVKWTLSELEDLDPSHERFDAKVRVLRESVLHHAEEEERELFPLIRQAMGRRALQQLGEAIATTRETAPTRPHPRSPDTPPANLITGVLAGAADKARDAGRAAVARTRR